MGPRPLTWRALGVYVPLDLLFRLVVWVGYRAMLGPLDADSAGRLEVVALAVTLPFIGAWMAGLFVILAPIDRWLTLREDPTRAGPDGPHGCPIQLRRTRRAARRAPVRFALLWMLSWVVPFLLLNFLVLEGHSGDIHLGRETWIGAALLCAALPLGALSLAVTFLSWFLGPTVGRLAMAAHAGGADANDRGGSLRWRTLMVALSLGLTPVLWLASITYMSSVRQDAERGRLQAELAARDGGELAAEVAPMGRGASGEEGFVAELIGSQLGIILFLGIVVSLYAILCAGFLAGSIGTPVASIARVMRDITDQCDVTRIQRIPVFQRDEIGDLVEQANRMLDRLEETAQASRAAEASLRVVNEELEKRVLERTSQLAASHSQLEISVAELCSTQRELMQASRLGGMAEVATVVLHNIGNLLTSVNVSAEVVAEIARDSRAARLGELARLMEQHRPDLAEFLSADERGRLIPAYLLALAGEIGEERAAIDAEMSQLRANLDHIKSVIGAQQSLAYGGVVAIERVDPSLLVEEALKLSLLRGGQVEVIRDMEAIPPVSLDRHMVMQILTNLLRNAQDAVDGVAGARIQIRVSGRPGGRFAIEVTDNGSGIAPENLFRIFNHGFSTKREGNGFGLHSSACSARVMRGSLTAASPGPGKGATFTLELPINQPVSFRSAEQSAA